MVMGHSVPTSKTTNEKAYEGGSFINFDTGINIQTTLKGSLLIIVGYQRQSASETLKNVFRYPAYGDLLQEYSFKRVAFSVGYRVNL